MDAPTDSPRRIGRARTWFALAAILAAATGLRLISLTREAVWFDEVTVLQALDSPNLADFVRNIVRSNPVPPGFMITEYLWSRLAGTEVAALRTWPLICGVASLGVLFLLTRRLLGERTALLATLWVSFMYWHIDVSQEIRYYPLSTLFVLLSVWTFAEFSAAPSRTGLALHALVNASMVWIHPLTAFLCMAQAVFLLRYRRNQPRFVGAWLGVHALLALSLVAFVASLNQKLALAQAGWIPVPTLWGGSPSVSELISTAAGAVPLAPTNAAGRAMLGVQPWAAAALVLMHIAAAFVGLRMVRRGPPESSSAGILPPHELTALLLLWMLLPPTLVFLLSHLWRPMFVVRYVLFASFPAYLLLAHALAARPRALAAAALSLLVAYDALFYFPGPSRMPFDRAAALVQAKASGPPVVLVDDMTLKSSIEYYWRGEKRPVRPWIELDTFLANPDIDLWLVYCDERRVKRAIKNVVSQGATAEPHRIEAGRPLWAVHVRKQP